jgi:hypothetical protein
MAVEAVVVAVKLVDLVLVEVPMECLSEVQEETSVFLLTQQLQLQILVLEEVEVEVELTMLPAAMAQMVSLLLEFLHPRHMQQFQPSSVLSPSTQTIIS